MAWCVRITWLYYDRATATEYLHKFEGFGALHDKEDNLHSHYYIITDLSSKKIRNDLNRYKTDEKPEKGFRPLTIQELKSTVPYYYDYVCRKEESKDLWINGMEEPEKPNIEQKTAKSKSGLMLAEDYIGSLGTGMDYQEISRKLFDWYVMKVKMVPFPQIFKQQVFTLFMRSVTQKDYEDLREEFVKDAAGITWNCSPLFRTIVERYSKK